MTRWHLGCPHTYKTNPGALECHRGVHMALAGRCGAYYERSNPPAVVPPVGFYRAQLTFCLSGSISSRGTFGTLCSIQNQPRGIQVPKRGHMALKVVYDGYYGWWGTPRLILQSITKFLSGSIRWHLGVPPIHTKPTRGHSGPKEGCIWP